MAKGSAALKKSENRIWKEAKERDEGLKEKANDDAVLDLPSTASSGKSMQGRDIAQSWKGAAYVAAPADGDHGDDSDANTKIEEQEKP